MSWADLLQPYNSLFKPVRPNLKVPSKSYIYCVVKTKKITSNIKFFSAGNQMCALFQFKIQDFSLVYQKTTGRYARYINAYILYNIIAKFSFTCSFGHGLKNFDCSK